MLSDQIKGNIDVLLVSETKIDDSFPIRNLFIDGFSTPYRLDRNSNGGGLMLFVREDISSNLVNRVVLCTSPRVQLKVIANAGFFSNAPEIIIK